VKFPSWSLSTTFTALLGPVTAMLVFGMAAPEGSSTCPRSDAGVWAASDAETDSKIGHNQIPQTVCRFGTPFSRQTETIDQWTVI
jgi:hypothetical protein